MSFVFSPWYIVALILLVAIIAMTIVFVKMDKKDKGLIQHFVDTVNNKEGQKPAQPNEIAKQETSSGTNQEVKSANSTMPTDIENKVAVSNLSTDNYEQLTVDSVMANKINNQEQSGNATISTIDTKLDETIATNNTESNSEQSAKADDGSESEGKTE